MSFPSLTRSPIVPGLHDSPPAHWQSWLQARHPHAVRVQQCDWAARVGATLERSRPGRRLAVAHSFGVPALLRHLVREPRSPVAAAAEAASPFGGARPHTAVAAA